MVAWPSDLPCSFVTGSEVYTEQPNVDEFQPDYGPSLMGTRYTGLSAELSGEMPLTPAQRTSFLTFFRTTIKQGALEFTMNNPITGMASKTVRLKPPSIRHVAGGLYLASLTFTVLN